MVSPATALAFLRDGAWALAPVPRQCVPGAAVFMSGRSIRIPKTVTRRRELFGRPRRHLPHLRPARPLGLGLSAHRAIPAAETPASPDRPGPHAPAGRVLPLLPRRAGPVSGCLPLPFARISRGRALDARLRMDRTPHDQPLSCGGDWMARAIPPVPAPGEPL